MVAGRHLAVELRATRCKVHSHRLVDPAIDVKIIRTIRAWFSALSASMLFIQSFRWLGLV